MTTSLGEPGTTTTTFESPFWVVVVTVPPAVAVAPLSWVAIPSVPGLATRTVTLMLLGESCVAVALDGSTAGAVAGFAAAPGDGAVSPVQTEVSGH
ncbi:MAG: hypothetical protein WAQ33_17190 [Gaiellaceae bacterium]